VKRLQDIEPPEFRLRVGDYRLRFHDLGDSLYITAVKHRAKSTAELPSNAGRTRSNGCCTESHSVRVAFDFRSMTGAQRPR